MMGYDYEVVFRKGTANTVADALSRKPSIHLCAISIVTSTFLQKIQRSWLSDPSLIHLMHKLKTSTDKPSKYSWEKGQLRRKGKLVVGQDPKLKEELLSLFHSSFAGGHSGAEATMKRLGSVCYSKGLKKHVREFVSHEKAWQRMLFERP